MTRLIGLLLCCLLLTNAKAEEDSAWARTIQNVSSSIVSIRVDAVRSFDTAASSTTQATGFVVDARRGLILTNRHVVQSGPVIAEALFSNHEEVELKPVYRDPVHDFGFFQYDPGALKFINPKTLKLRPERAKVGREIRVVGNDAGEQLSILAGTLARLDRPAPDYGRGRYNDFNTFYYQSASGVSGGSSGSPVIDINGDVIALNAAGNRNAASSFFLPLDRIVRALKLIQKNETISRGTLQTTFEYVHYDEARRLGLRPQLEAELRKVNHGFGLLVVSHSLPGGPAYGLLQPGDILIKGWAGKQKPSWIRQFAELETLFDDNVNQAIHLLLERNGAAVEVELQVGDLHEITPDRYISFGDAIVHNLSYQQARHLNRPIEGAYVAQPGFVLSTAGVPAGAVILQLDNQDIRNLDDFERVINSLSDGKQVSVRFITFKETMRNHVTIMNMDRRWFPLQKCVRNDVKAYWPCEPLAKGPIKQLDQPVNVDFVNYKDERANRLSSSIVYVQFDMPYHVDGVLETHYGGSGLVIDADDGLVLVDRNTVPIAMGDVRIIFAGAVDLPGRVLFVHPLHNFAIVQYDPALLGNSGIKTAPLRNTQLESGDDVWLVGIKGDQSLQVEQMKVASIDPLQISIPQVPAFRETNLDVIVLNNAPFSHGGVLTDKAGNVVAIWSSFSYGEGNEHKQFEWGVPIEMVQELLEQWQCCKSFRIHSLEVELATLSIAQARKLGMSNDWLEKFQDADDRRQLLAVSRRVAGSDAHYKLQEGDLLVKVNGKLVRTFRDVERNSQQEEVKLTIVRSGTEMEVDVKTALLDGRGTDRIVRWNGALLQNPHRALAAQRGIRPDGVYISFVWWGSPASRYRLSALYRITEIDGEKVNNLDEFIKLAKLKQSKTYLQVKVLDLIDREAVITLKQDHVYWPTQEIFWDGDGWMNRAL
ncbi:MAG TPA: trypsin-like peptidase domain-containing protein [Gammaproteobacteria bacterium]